MFVNREQELEILEKRYRSRQAEFFVLYGRRRVGKTHLLRRFCQDKPHIFFVADLSGEALALQAFTREVSRALYQDPEYLPAFGNWEQALGFLVPHVKEKRLVVVLDEFPYLVEMNHALPSLLQRVWDASLQDTQIMLLVSGSHIGMMEEHVLGHRSPLFGRRTGQLKLQPLSFWDAQQFFPDWAPEERVRAYAVLGGMPLYLKMFQNVNGVIEGIRRSILQPDGLLYDEPHFLLRQEVREPARYFAVLEALAAGRTRKNEIAQRAHIPPNSLTFYLQTLMQLDLVTYHVPVDVRQPHKFRRGRYRLADPFLRFWFRFVFPHRFSGMVETETVLEHIRHHIDEFTSWTFEDIAREALFRLARRGDLPWVPARVGAWWDRDVDVEIDVAGINLERNEAILGECKWTRQPVDIRVLGDLQRKAQHFTWRTQMRVRTLILFSRSGFTPGVESAAREQGWVLVDLPNLVNL